MRTGTFNFTRDCRRIWKMIILIYFHHKKVYTWSRSLQHLVLWNFYTYSNRGFGLLISLLLLVVLILFSKEPEHSPPSDAFLIILPIYIFYYFSKVYNFLILLSEFFKYSSCERLGGHKYCKCLPSACKISFYLFKY